MAMVIRIVNKMSDKQAKKFLNKIRWDSIRYELGVGYSNIISMTGCRGYMYGEDPDAYMDLVTECYDKYCEVYPDEAGLRDRQKEKWLLCSDDFEEFLEKKLQFDEMEERMMEAKAEDKERTNMKRRKEFRILCERLDLLRFF